MTGKELRRIRGLLKLTRAQVAARIGVSPNTIRRWERGRVTSRDPFARLNPVHMLGFLLLTMKPRKPRRGR